MKETGRERKRSGGRERTCRATELRLLKGISADRPVFALAVRIRRPFGGKGPVALEAENKGTLSYVERPLTIGCRG